MVETAIVMVVVLLLLFGIIDFGRAMYTYAYVAQLARQGARWAIVRGSQCTVLDSCNFQTSTPIQTYVQGLNEGAMTGSSIGVVPSWSCATTPKNAPGCTVLVTVTYPFKFIAPFISTATINMSSTSQMVISQ